MDYLMLEFVTELERHYSTVHCVNREHKIHYLRLGNEFYLRKGFKTNNFYFYLEVVNFHYEIFREFSVMFLYNFDQE